MAEVLALLRTGMTNVGSEGSNRIIKTTVRAAHGFRSPKPASMDPAALQLWQSCGCLNPALFSKSRILRKTASSFPTRRANRSGSA